MSASAGPKSSGPAYHVLVVEDDESSRRTLARLLELSGFRVTAVPDAPSALSAVVSATSPVDLVLTDYHLPGVDGVRLIRELRSSRPSMVVAVMTGATSEESTDALEAVGADLLFFKPLRIGVVAQRFRDMLSRADAEPNQGTP